jgi:hypothetical protein
MGGGGAEDFSAHVGRFSRMEWGEYERLRFRIGCWNLVEGERVLRSICARMVHELMCDTIGNCLLQIYSHYEKGRKACTTHEPPGKKIFIGF